LKFKQIKLIFYQKIKNIHLHDELFSLENNFVTPTMKLKRVELRIYFKEIINGLYDEIEKKKSKL
jgi:long-chain acyl-CoA synthetase